MFFPVSEDQFRELGREIMNVRAHRQRSRDREDRRFKAFFGVKPARAYETWSLLIGHRCLPPNAKPEYLLWALLFLKIYATEAVLSGLIGHDENTIRKWVWWLVKALAKLSKHLVSSSC
jgi:hypothetical protein